jgi:hypothetical protein
MPHAPARLRSLPAPDRQERSSSDGESRGSVLVADNAWPPSHVQKAARKFRRDSWRFIADFAPAVMCP